MSRSIVGNRASSGSDHRPIVRLIIASDDRSYDQSCCPATDRTITRAARRPIVRSLVAFSERLHFFGIMVQTIGGTTSRKAVQLVAPTNVVSYNGWHHKLSEDTTSCTTSRVTA